MLHTLDTIYIAMTLFTTLIVALTIQSNGSVLMRHVFSHQPEIAKANSRLVLMGFVLITTSIIVLTLPQSRVPLNKSNATETLIESYGLFLLFISVIYFLTVKMIKHVCQKQSIANKMDALN